MARLRNCERSSAGADCKQALTNTTGFFFERDQRLFVVTSRHVLIDEPSKHFPDRIEIELHVNPHTIPAAGSTWA